MFSFNFSQIMGLFLFFFGLIVLNRCSAMERRDYMARSLPETTHPARADSRQREMIGPPPRRPRYTGRRLGPDATRGPENIQGVRVVMQDFTSHKPIVR
ncbi:MAG: hypothetical protein IIB46_06585 [Nitrospinae bacterium]|nr:hypothetical protein [Nitrospinota bacterium]